MIRAIVFWTISCPSFKDRLELLPRGIWNLQRPSAKRETAEISKSLKESSSISMAFAWSSVATASIWIVLASVGLSCDRVRGGGEIRYFASIRRAAWERDCSCSLSNSSTGTVMVEGVTGSNRNCSKNDWYVASDATFATLAISLEIITVNSQSGYILDNYDIIYNPWCLYQMMVV